MHPRHRVLVRIFPRPRAPPKIFLMAQSVQAIAGVIPIKFQEKPWRSSEVIASGVFSSQNALCRSSHAARSQDSHALLSADAPD
jgi:hypothetical protein